MRKMLRFRTDYFLLSEYFRTNHIAVRLEKKRHSGSRTDHLAKKENKKKKKEQNNTENTLHICDRYMVSGWNSRCCRIFRALSLDLVSHLMKMRAFMFSTVNFSFRQRECVRSLAHSINRSHQHFPWIIQLNLNWIRTTKWQPKIKNYERKNKQITTIIRTLSARLTVIHATTT